MKSIRIEMTGSPKTFGYHTKEEFMDALTPFNVQATKITRYPDYLITNDLSSETNKMKRANQDGIRVLTYGQLIDKYRVEMRKRKIQEIQEKIKKK